MTRAYPLTSSVPAPRRKRPAFPMADLGLKEMAVGDSFLIESEKLPKSKRGFLTNIAGQRVHVAALRAGIRVRVSKRLQDRDGEAGLRVWRIK